MKIIFQKDDFFKSLIMIISARKHDPSKKDFPRIKPSPEKTNRIATKKIRLIIILKNPGRSLGARILQSPIPVEPLYIIKNGSMQPPRKKNQSLSEGSTEASYLSM